MVRSTGNRPVIGLTGGIGAGKSLVGRILARLGCVVSVADLEARRLLDDPEVRAELVRWWGEGILAADGTVDRPSVGRIVFADPAERARLEALVHPRVRARRDEAFAAAPPDAPALVIDAPLLFEAGLDADCDVVVLVDAPRAVRLERVRRDRGWDEAELDRREAAQWPLDAKRARADHVLDNAEDAGSPEQADGLEHRVRALLREVTIRHSQRSPGA